MRKIDLKEEMNDENEMNQVRIYIDDQPQRLWLHKDLIRDMKNHPEKKLDELLFRQFVAETTLIKDEIDFIIKQALSFKWKDNVYKVNFRKGTYEKKI